MTINIALKSYLHATENGLFNLIYNNHISPNVVHTVLLIKSNVECNERHLSDASQTLAFPVTIRVSLRSLPP